MRVFLALLLCLTVAFQSAANAHVSSPSCPMAEGSATVDEQSSSVADDACCEQADEVSESGEVCETEQACQLSQAGVLTMVWTSGHASTTSGLIPVDDQALVPFDRSSVWRPPTHS